MLMRATFWDVPKPKTLALDNIKTLSSKYELICSFLKDSTKVGWAGHLEENLHVFSQNAKDLSNFTDKCKLLAKPPICSSLL